MCFREALSKVHASPGMYGLNGSYLSFVTFLMGCDFGNAGGLLRGFNEWLAVRLGQPIRLHWSALCLMIAFPSEDPRVTSKSLTADQDPQAVEALFALVDEFLEASWDLRKMTCMYHDYWELREGFKFEAKQSDLDSES